MEIRQMRLQDVPKVAQLEKCCFRDPWSERSIASELDNPLAYWLVAVEKDEVLGYVGSQTVMGEADMMNVAVSEKYRRLRIANALITRLIEDLSRRGAYSLSLEVRASNAPAIALYEKLAFVQIGRRPNYYRNPKEDALILRKEWSK